MGFFAERRLAALLEAGDLAAAAAALAETDRRLDSPEADDARGFDGDGLGLRPRHLRLFAVERSGERALAVWEGGGIGGGLVAMRRLDGGWTRTVGATFGGCVRSTIDLEEFLDPHEP